MKSLLIWKFKLDAIDQQEVEMPEGAEILTAQVMDGWICLWAKVDPDKEMVYRQIELIETGERVSRNCNDERKYIATVQVQREHFEVNVIHVFESIPQEYSSED
jgi:hypothetical protein